MSRSDCYVQEDSRNFDCRYIAYLMLGFSFEGELKRSKRKVTSGIFNSQGLESCNMIDFH